jgi:hypothetical protein
MRLFRAIAGLGLFGVLSIASPAIMFAQSSPPSRTMFDYQKELGLTSDQIAKIKGAVTALQAKLADYRNKEKILNADRQTEIVNNADIGQIRKTLHALADLQIEANLADIETSRAINSTLSPEQLKAWHDIQAKIQSQAGK